MPKGFASLTKERRKQVAAKGGESVQKRKTGHAFNPLNSKAASAKGVAARKRNLARKAALQLMKMGFTPAQLNAAQLSEDEFIYFGGGGRTTARIQTLVDRINTIIGAENAITPETPDAI